MGGIPDEQFYPEGVRWDDPHSARHAARPVVGSGRRIRLAARD